MDENNVKALELKIEKYKIVYENFKDMEQRYHTWMNYYAIFNGALLVAITSDFSNIKCISWEQADCCFTLLITLLGIISSYCWYLSSIGHHAWLNDWRIKLQKIYPEVNHRVSKNRNKFKKIFCGKVVLPDYLSTNSITNVFILSVLLSWITVGSSIINKLSNNIFDNSYIVLFSLLIWFILIKTKKIAHYFWGSDLTGFEDENGEK